MKSRNNFIIIIIITVIITVIIYCNCFHSVAVVLTLVANKNKYT